jgi:hypothetical protein
LSLEDVLTPKDRVSGFFELTFDETFGAKLDFIGSVVSYFTQFFTFYGDFFLIFELLERASLQSSIIFSPD